MNSENPLKNIFGRPFILWFDREKKRSGILLGILLVLPN